MITIKNLGALMLAMTITFATLAANAQTFEWVRDDIDVYDIKVISVDRNRLKAEITGVGTRTFKVPTDFRFDIDGVPTKVSALVPRQKLKAYVTRSETGTLQLVDAGPVRTVVPVAAARTPVVADVAPATTTAMLPKTGNVFPISLALGLAFGSLALVLRSRRRHG